MRIRHETLTTVFDTVYLALVTNALLVVACLPLAVAVLLTDPARSWPLLALLAPLCAPGLCGAFAVFAAYGVGGPVRSFVRGWRASLRRAVPAAAAGTAALVVLGVDVRAAWGRPIGAVVIPVLVTGMALVAATTVLVLVVLAERPGVRLRDAARACLFLVVRRWYLTVLSLAVLALLEALLAARPALAAGLAAAPLLYVVWSNSRYTLGAVLGPVKQVGSAGPIEPATP
ncbi:MAG TPA: hypothetical protein VGB74_16305 [Actinoplanes sp.]